MDINITKFFNEENADEFSGSIATHGENAGKQTWEAALAAYGRYEDFLDTDEKREAFRNYVKGFGAWTDEEIAGWENHELTGLLIQMIAAEMKEDGLNVLEPDWEAHALRTDNSGRIFKGDDGEVYYTLD